MKLLVISSYPEKNLIHGNKTVGVGNYTKATLLSLVKRNPELDIEVLAEVLDEQEEYKENKINVTRIWKRGSASSIVKLYSSALSNPAKVILLPLEMYMYGTLLHLLITFPFLFLLKLQGKKVILVLHQVLGGSVSKFEQNNFKALFYSAFKSVFYKSLVLLTSKIIVFEEEFKKRLGSSNKVLVIPLAVMPERILDKETSKEKLGLDKDKKYVFYFGFLSPYKGIEELLNIWDPIDDVQLIIGGGGNPNHMNKPEYKTFVDNLLQKSKEKGALTTGFIPQDQMGLYFSAVDIVILPYTVFMSSSGPLAHAFSYARGVLLSDELKEYFNSQDMRKALELSGITPNEICFDLNKSIRSKILWAVHNQSKLEEFSRKMFQVRSWDVLSGEYNKVIMDSA
ncbi:glycosyltransferase [Patescibacteria group bacterium]